MKPNPTMLCLVVCGALAFGTGRAAEAPSKHAAAPRVQLSWNAPWGEPRATDALATDCRDTTRSDTLYLTFVAPRNILPLTGLSAVLLFEPEGGDTLGRFWEFERGARNAGNLSVDFEPLASETCDRPWRAAITGSVGYTRAGGRGRLDLSADVPDELAKNLIPNLCYMGARVVIRHRLSMLPGCSQPVRITWVGGWFRSTRPGGRDIALAMGQDRTVTWNARRGGVSRRRTDLAVETWVPVFAPWSTAALVERAEFLSRVPRPGAKSE
jgi:hypothetical protein